MSCSSCRPSPDGTGTRSIPVPIVRGGRFSDRTRFGTCLLYTSLIDKVLRTEIGLILESGEPREVHHFCTLIGYGVTAINPYVALETVRDLQARKRLGDITPEEAEKNYIKAAVGGIMKVMSKMGISTVRSYHGAQIFEAFNL